MRRDRPSSIYHLNPPPPQSIASPSQNPLETPPPPTARSTAAAAGYDKPATFATPPATPTISQPITPQTKQNAASATAAFAAPVPTRSRVRRYRWFRSHHQSTNCRSPRDLLPDSR